MPTPKRPRGAPPGNLNALKHGFYSRGFRTMDIADLDAMLENGLESEINMLRVSTRRLLELSQENTDVDQGIHLLSVLGATATRLAGLMRAQADFAVCGRLPVAAIFAKLAHSPHSP